LGNRVHGTAKAVVVMLVEVGEDHSYSLELQFQRIPYWSLQVVEPASWVTTHPVMMQALQLSMQV
jgi:hypothetical protein